MSQNKRTAPDPVTVEWKDTNIDELRRSDLDHLLKNRALDGSGLKKEEASELLKKEGKVMIEKPEALTNVALLSELRLRGLNDDPSKKDVLLARYRGEDTDEPPKKKARVGRKQRGKKASCYTALYFPPNNQEKDDKKNDNNNDDQNSDAYVLGVFKSEQRVYEAAILKLLEDIQNKSEKDYKALHKQIEKKLANEYKEKFDLISGKCSEVFGDGEDPYVTIKHHDIE